MNLTYSKYLELDELLGLQKVRSDPPEHDELLFIIIHQVYELWFKLLLHEFEKVKLDLSSNELFKAIATFKRMRTIVKTLVGQLDILETMTPMSFTAFRDRLETASGFQSYQFREFEFVLGYKRPQMMEPFAAGSQERKRLERRLKERSVVDHFYDFLAHQGVAIPDELRTKDPTSANGANAEVQKGVLRLYRERPDVAILFELMTDLDEGIQEWRYRHVKLAERAIGSKRGTGGSTGVEFLKQSLFRPAFHDLWAVREKL
jgi:tryptophan 2,3-dioxygenase